MSNYRPKENPRTTVPASCATRARVIGLGIAGVLLPASFIEAVNSADWSYLAVPLFAALVWTAIDWCEEFLEDLRAPQRATLAEEPQSPLWLLAANNCR